MSLCPFRKQYDYKNTAWIPSDSTIYNIEELAITIRHWFVVDIEDADNKKVMDLTFLGQEVHLNTGDEKNDPCPYIVDRYEIIRLTTGEYYSYDTLGVIKLYLKPKG